MPRDTDAPPPDETPPPETPSPRSNGRKWPAVAGLAPIPLPEGAPAASPHAATAERDRWTVGRLLAWTKDYLQKRGSESPRLDAEVLLAKVLGWQRVQLYTH